MPYAVKQNMIDRFSQAEIVQLTDRAVPPTGLINDAVLDQALADAEDTINGYLQGRYNLPLANTPQMLTRVACDLARYYLYDNHATEEVRRRHDADVKFLTDVAAGKIQLGLDAAAQPVTPSSGPEVSAPEREFTKDTLKEF